MEYWHKLSQRGILAVLGVVLVSVVAVIGFDLTGNSVEQDGVGRAGLKARAGRDSLDAVGQTASPSTAAEMDERVRHLGAGAASYYGDELAGRPTASGEVFDPKKLTAAHRTLPLGARVRVTNLRNDASVVVRVNDRGPFTERRIIDVSRAAARELGMLGRGVARVRVEVVRGGQ